MSFRPSKVSLEPSGTLASAYLLWLPLILWQSWVVVTETLGPQSREYWISVPRQKLPTDPWRPWQRGWTAPAGRGLMGGLKGGGKRDAGGEKRRKERGGSEKGQGRSPSLHGGKVLACVLDHDGRRYEIKDAYICRTGSFCCTAGMDRIF